MNYNKLAFFKQNIFNQLKTAIKAQSDCNDMPLWFIFKIYVKPFTKLYLMYQKV